MSCADTFFFLPASCVNNRDETLSSCVMKFDDDNSILRVDSLVIVIMQKDWEVVSLFCVYHDDVCRTAPDGTVTELT